MTSMQVHIWIGLDNLTYNVFVAFMIHFMNLVFSPAGFEHMN